MLSISYWANKVSTKISASEKFIGGQTHTLDIYDDLMGGQNRIHRPYASLTSAELSPDQGPGVDRSLNTEVLSATACLESNIHIPLPHHHNLDLIR